MGFVTACLALPSTVLLLGLGRHGAYQGRHIWRELAAKGMHLCIPKSWKCCPQLPILTSQGAI